jgi:hypothetical protein
MRKFLTIYEEDVIVIYDFATDHLIISLYMRKFDLLFYQCRVEALLFLQLQPPYLYTWRGGGLMFKESMTTSTYSPPQLSLPQGEDRCRRGCCQCGRRSASGRRAPRPAPQRRCAPSAGSWHKTERFTSPSGSCRVIITILWILGCFSENSDWGDSAF